MNIDNLPTEIFAKLLKFFTFDELSRLRLVCHQFDFACRQALNAGFQRAEKYHLQLVQRLKIQLPRRESERRTHELSRHSDVLGAMETRLSLLTMTYNKFIETGICCFIPGKVLDEMLRVLRLIDASLKAPLSPGNQLSKPHELLQELRDISSMAMEYFDEKLLAGFREELANRIHSTTLSLPADLFSDFSTSVSPGACSTCSVKRAENVIPGTPVKRSKALYSDKDSLISLGRIVSNLNHRLRIQRSEISYLKQQLLRMKVLAERQSRRIKAQEQLIRSYHKIDIDKKLLELNTKLTDLSAELKRKTAKCSKRRSDDSSSGSTVATPQKRFKM